MWQSVSTAPFDRDLELGVVNNDIGSLIRLLGSPNDDQVLAAARTLVKEMEGIGGLNALAKLWEGRIPLQRPAKPRPKAFDFTKVDAAIELFVAEKTEVRLGEVRKVVLEQLAEVRALKDAGDADHLNAVTPYIRARLRNLGFKSRSGNILHREAPQPKSGWRWPW
jgi:hypothetical protein